MSAKALTIPPRALLCQLQEVKVLRYCNPFSDGTRTATISQQTTDNSVKNEKKPFKLSDIGVDLSSAKSKSQMQ